MIIKFSLLFVLAISLTGCAPGLGRTLPVTRIPHPEIKRGELAEHAPIVIGTFVDGRGERAVATIDGRDVSPEGDVANAVRAACEEYLRAKGYRPVLGDALVLNGTVEKWHVNISPKFPSSKLESLASIRIELNDSTGRAKFRGVYSGEYSEEKPLLSEDAIADGLGLAMGEALEQFASDSKIRAALSVSHQ